MCNKWLANSRHKGLAHQRILVLNKGLCVPNSVAHGCHADAVKGDTQAVKGDTQAVKGDTQAVKGDTQAVKGDTQAVKGDTQAVKGDTQAVKGDTQAVKGDTQAVKGDTQAVKGDTQAVKGDTQAEHGVHIYSALLQHQPVLHNRSLHLLQHSDQHEQGLQQSVSSHLHIDWQVVPWLQSAEETCTERGWLET